MHPGLYESSARSMSPFRRLQTSDPHREKWYDRPVMGKVLSLGQDEKPF